MRPALFWACVTLAVGLLAGRCSPVALAADPCSGHGVECCAQLRAGEPYSVSCERWASRFYPAFPQCCAGPAPSPSPEPTCPENWWECRPATPVCVVPTPEPTPRAGKNVCCRDAQAIYLATVRAARVKAKAIRVEQMRECREGYQR